MRMWGIHWHGQEEYRGEDMGNTGVRIWGTHG